ncbi:MAG: GNAT family N-acetyltransferase [Dehalococcoidia bacterium]|nr:GNAT family N-acetyltransferase [Dehalococcoidia bacterium]
MAQALEVRRAVFIDEQDVPEDLEIDEYDGDPALIGTALHVLASQDGEPVATGRLLLEAEHGYAHIGRVAVMKQHRRRGHGTAVMEALHELARERGFEGITLAAQLHAIGFYERLGYTVRSDVFLDAGIEHRWMDLSLALT